MDNLMGDYETIQVHLAGTLCTLQIDRPEAKNSINNRLIEDCRNALQKHRDSIDILVIEGLPDVFCIGADFKEIGAGSNQVDCESINAEGLWDLWTEIATGPFVSIAHVRGGVNAGGVGFVAACDIVLASESTSFSLSELLFGLMPACVLPFLVRRIGRQKAHYMTLMTQPVSVETATEWGLVDAIAQDSEDLLRKHLLRLRRLSKQAIIRYKRYMHDLDGTLGAAKPMALSANREVFSDQGNLDRIARYLETGAFPWEA
jgi:polyketide biosynthesis enoyl-CoA hydratase PksH